MANGFSRGRRRHGCRKLPERVAATPRRRTWTRRPRRAKEPNSPFGLAEGSGDEASPPPSLSMFSNRFRFDAKTPLPATGGIEPNTKTRFPVSVGIHAGAKIRLPLSVGFQSDASILFPVSVRLEADAEILFPGSALRKAEDL